MSPIVIFGVLLVSLIIKEITIHHVEEGCVGVYWKGGALMKEVSQPGYHGLAPFLTKFHSIPVTLKTSTVTNIPCGTSSGVIIYFSKVEVVHRLKATHVLETMKNYSLSYEKTWIHDRVHHEVNQICSKNTLHEVYITKFNELDEQIQDRLNHISNIWLDGGLEIVSIRFTKPKIPETIRQNYEIVDTYKTKLLILDQKQKTILREAQTAKRSAILEAEKEFDIAKINAKRLIQRKKSELEVSMIDDDMNRKRSEETTNAWFYRKIQEITAHKEKLTPEYLTYLHATKDLQNTEFYYGNHLPKSISTSSQTTMTSMYQHETTSKL